MKKFLLFLVATAFALASELSIATYNVENLFDAKNDGSEYKDFVIGKSAWNLKEANAKFDRIKEDIKRLDADIIALQEIENEEILKELMRQTGYKYFAFSKDKRAPIGLGLLSKIKPLKTQIFKVPNVKTRDIVMVDFELDGEVFSVYVNHMPAQKNSLKSRQAAFRTLKNAIQEDKNAILLGDFNTPYGEKSLLNDILISRQMSDLWEFLPKDERYSHINLSPIDHVVMSKSMFDKRGIEYVYGSFEVIKPLNFANSKPKFGEKIAGLNSDHFPLRFKISIGKKANEFTKASIDTLFNNPSKAPYELEKVCVIYKDKKGFIISQNRRGIYVYDPDNSYLLGSVMDVVVNSIGEFKGALEVNSMRVVKMHDKLADVKTQMLSASRLNEARAGDVIESISGEIKKGRLITPYGSVRVYSPKGKLADTKNAEFKAVRVGVYKGEIQLVVE
ncbi:endonuclease/exonuclease/phosphatase family protein [Campylobacter sp. CCUG 57310]|uniref:endonuclease/exonuclease/phosphatase family protein n=1 Tax=Campylobacter sp. CCUG 57310 TaxID=2517362 RepID=UPI0015633AEF|nr:endonuclease/exonuclease/phosphatase family protein [Campylobacter sp. CCUG 57310]QKF92375.1 endonuclease/exonuclease/phosphatase [Campylobacter sp. CCUG 57310]